MDKIQTALRDLPVEDKLTALVLSIVQSSPGPNNALCICLRMTRVTTMLSKGLSAVNRYKVSERMRSAADELERQQVACVDIEIE